MFISPTIVSAQDITTGLAPLQYWQSSVQKFFREYVAIPSANAQTTDIVTGLIGHWKFDETSGTTASDSSGNANTGTLVNGPTWTAGKINGALSFDGVDDYVRVPGNTPLELTGGEFTISVWTYLSSLPTGDDRRLIDKGGGTTGQGGWTIEIDGPNGRISVRINDGAQTFSNSSVLSANKWQHIIVRLSGGTIFFYVDGVAQGSGTKATPTGSSVDVHIGGRSPTSASTFLPATIDEVRVYNRALSASDIQELYNQGSGSTPPSSDTQAPSAPANLSATAISSSQINLSWTASTDNVGVTGYRVERCQGSTCTNFTQIATPSGTSYNDTGLAANTIYRYRVRATDAAGNLSSYSSIANATTQAPPSSGSVGLYDMFETSITNTKSYSNPFDFNVIELRATFTSPTGRQVPFFGFHDGDGNGGQTGNVWKLRFMPDEVGTWNYTYTWTDGTPGGSGSFNVVDTGLPGPLKVAKDNSWYFEDARGKPFNFRGYDISSYLFYSPTKKITSEAQNLKNMIQTRMVNRGYNFTMWEGMGDRLGQNTSWHRESFWLNTSDTKRFNISVLTAWEDVLKSLKDNKIYTITFWYIWQGQQYGFTDFQVFLRYWTARYGAFYNFTGWNPTWEWTDIWSASQVNQIMQYVYDIDPWKRLLSVHDCSHSTFGNWLRFSMRQAHSNNAFMGNSRTAGQSQGSCGQPGGVAPAFLNQPIIGSEDIWESTFSSMPRNATEVRRAAWGIQMGGMMPLYSEWTPDPPPTGGNGQGEPEVRRMFDFFYSKTRYRQYQQLNNLVSSSARQIASGIPGEEYLVYDEDGGSITINLSGAPSSKSFSVLWYNPATGAQQTGSTVNGGASRTLTSPFSGDSVLLLGGLPSDTTPPTTPSNLTASVSGQSVTLNWSASSDSESGISAYKVYRCQGTSCTTSLLATPGNVTTYTDSATAPNSTYTYQVSAVNGAGLESSTSSSRTATTGDNPPQAPTGLLAQPGSQQVTLTWTANSEQDIAGYHVYRSTTNGGPYTQITASLLTTTTYTNTGLTNGTTYYYVIRAQDTGGQQSSNSQQVSATPTDILIVTLENYQGSNTAPTVHNAGTTNAFKVGSLVVNDRYDTWTSVPPSLNDQTRLLTARNDRQQSPTDSKYIVTVSQPVTVYVTLDPRYAGTYPSWITSQGWTVTSLTANSSALSNWTIHQKNFPAGSITLGTDTIVADGVTYVFTRQTGSTPPPSSTKFQINDRVQVTGTGGTGLNVRSCASTSCSILGSQAEGNQGTVIGGPTTADGFNWWNINYDAGADGWSAEDFLTKVTTTSDTIAPSVPTNLSATAQSSSQINLSWTASTDNVGVTGYRVERCSGSSCTNFAQISTPSGTSHFDTGLSTNTTYRYQVRAADGAGNLSGYSSVVSATTQTAPTGGTALGNLAASMAPGTWAILDTNGFNNGTFLETAYGKSILQWADKAVWDPGSRQFLFLGQPHFELAKFAIYSDATNSWQVGPLFCSSCIGHAYEHNAINPITGDVYHRVYASRAVHRYNIPTGMWYKLPDVNVVGYMECCGALEFFPEMNGLVYINGDEFTPGVGNVYFFNMSTSQWSSIANNVPMGGYSVFASYNPVHKVVLFGGGYSNIINKLDQNGIVTGLKPAPIQLGIYRSVVTVDPVSGKYLIFGADRTFYEYDIMTDTWRLMSGTVPLFNPSGDPPVFDIVAAPVNTYGVVMFKVDCFV